jgi:hypothetical protein
MGQTMASPGQYGHRPEIQTETLPVFRPGCHRPSPIVTWRRWSGPLNAEPVLDTYPLSVDVAYGVHCPIDPPGAFERPASQTTRKAKLVTQFLVDCPEPVHGGSRNARSAFKSIGFRLGQSRTAITLCA